MPSVWSFGPIEDRDEGRPDGTRLPHREFTLREDGEPVCRVHLLVAVDGDGQPTLRTFATSLVAETQLERRAA